MRLLRTVIAALLVAAPLALIASPTSAQVPVEITGDADCNEDGTYTLFWTIENFVGGTIEVVEAELSGAATGSVDFTPDPIPPNETASGSFDVPGDTAGIVTLSIDILGPKFSFEDSYDIELEGDCEAIVTTTTTTSTTLAPTTTTTAPAARPLALTPAFTG